MPNFQKIFEKLIKTEKPEDIQEQGKEQNSSFTKKNVVSPQFAKKSVIVKKVKPQDAHKLGLILISDKKFKHLFKHYVGKLIINKQNLTRVDVIIEEQNDKQLLDLYGMTEQHFEDITNGNLSSFDLAADGPDLAITFKIKSGEDAIRPLDDSKLAELLNIVLKLQPELAPPSLKSDQHIK